MFASPALAIRPLFTDDWPENDYKDFDLEIGTLSNRISGFDSNITTTISPIWGVLPNLDVRVDIPYTYITPSGTSNINGVGDITLKSKINFLPVCDCYCYGLSTTVAVKLPTANSQSGLGTGTTDYLFNVILTRNIEPFNLHFNLGYNILGQPDGQRLVGTMFYGSAAEYHLNSLTSLFAEVFGTTSSDPNTNTNQTEMQIGINRMVSDSVMLDCGYIVGLTDSSPTNRLNFGLTAFLP